MSRAAPGCVSSLLWTDPTACIRYAHCPHCTSEPFPPALSSSPAVEAPGGAATGLLWIPIISHRKLCRIKAFALVPSYVSPQMSPTTSHPCHFYFMSQLLCYQAIVLLYIPWMPMPLTTTGQLLYIIRVPVQISCEAFFSSFACIATVFSLMYRYNGPVYITYLSAH